MENLKKVLAWLALRRAENAMIRRYGVSRAYAREVVANAEAYARGEMSFDRCQHGFYVIASRYPQDAAMVVDGAYRRGEFDR